jgi:hypothetical protein
MGQKWLRAHHLDAAGVGYDQCIAKKRGYLHGEGRDPGDANGLERPTKTNAEQARAFRDWSDVMPIEVLQGEAEGRFNRSECNCSGSALFFRHLS